MFNVAIVPVPIGRVSSDVNTRSLEQRARSTSVGTVRIGRRVEADERMERSRWSLNFAIIKHSTSRCEDFRLSRNGRYNADLFLQLLDLECEPPRCGQRSIVFFLLLRSH